mgnify:CR=1 FL=1
MILTIMDYNYIKQLLERYWACETTVEEESILKAFFSQKSVPAELAKYQALFVYEATEPKTDVLGDDFDARMLAMTGHLFRARPSSKKYRYIKVIFINRFGETFTWKWENRNNRPFLLDK